MKSNQTTIKDIARSLGISPSTVSRALKDHPDISMETRKAVKKLAREWNYQPNAVALSLKHSRSFTIGVIIPETVHYFFSTVISGIEDVAYEAGYNIMICQSNEMYDREVSNAQMLYSNRVDGLLVSLAKQTEKVDHLKFFQDNNIPVVFFDRGTDAFPCDQVLIDDYKAAYLASCHLIRRGHKRLIHLAAPQNLIIGRNRYRGFLDALNDNGIDALIPNLFPADQFDMGYEVLDRLIETKSLPDGIFAVNDLTALGAIKALKKAKINLPGQVGIVGFGNSDHATLIEPTLTTIDQNGYSMGKTAAKLLLKRINGGLENYQPEKHIIETRLIERESTL
ncbi:MAG TPA: LacI family DNA-binding transcriptional regulator [Prolixibacteraceae bacterium]|nr:LacI family DNA-binding transcriptional regulator [Prolixibacteraceae bacterium]